ncbi:MAG: hypothetical protein AB1410_11555 [Acidobacteriota bacterium]
MKKTFSKSKNSLKLTDNSRIAIIGGGPAGAFFAFYLLKLAREKKLNLSVEIYEGKYFSRSGPPGCNYCAGVISETLIEKMEKIGIALPQEIAQSRVEGYYMKTIKGGLLLTHPLKRNKIATVFRGNGPLFSNITKNISFDDFLLREATKMGAKVYYERVNSIEIPPNLESKTILRVGNNNKYVEADLVVGAFGLNTNLMEKMKNMGFGYKPPKTLKTFQTEIKLDSEFIKQKFGNNIYIFNMGIDNLRFVAIVPKGEFLTLTLVGKKDVTFSQLKKFLNFPHMKEMLPENWSFPLQHCHCLPRIATTPAKKPYTNRLVIIGDASCSRYYKNGIESALITASLAAEAAINYGISEENFKHEYYKKAKKIIVDNYYGRLLFYFNDFISRFAFVVESHLRIGLSKGYTSTLLKNILWNMFTGNIEYKRIFFRTLNPVLQISMLSSIFLTIWINLKRRLFERNKTIIDKNLSKKIPLTLSYRKMSSEKNLKSLKNGSVVVIIGGGPAGCGCAIALKKLSRMHGKNIEVVIYEGKIFEGERQFNQCAGVLSPPIKEILEKELNIDFPHNLVQRTIVGYILHSDLNSILLDGQSEPSYAIRRIKFDEFLLNQAAKLGIKVINARMVDLEFLSDKVIVYSENGNTKADMVVGAFGLDDGSAKIFERVTPYRQPRFLSSIVTKVHPGQEFMDKFGNRIHAFLPSFKEIEFGAITPKGNHLTINIAGERITSDSMDKFLDYLPVKEELPPGIETLKEKMDYFKGKFPISTAQGMFGDRYVIIGDAAGLIRPFKGKGVNAGIITGIKAAYTMIEVGISKGAFQKFYESCDDVLEDLPYGRLVRRLAILFSNFKLMPSILEKAKNDAKLKEALFDCVSANRNYKEIWRNTISFKTILEILGAIGNSFLNKTSS